MLLGIAGTCCCKTRCIITEIQNENRMRAPTISGRDRRDSNRVVMALCC